MVGVGEGCGVKEGGGCGLVVPAVLERMNFQMKIWHDNKSQRLTGGTVMEQNSPSFCSTESIY